jgi:hypothetical protein
MRLNEQQYLHDYNSLGEQLHVLAKLRTHVFVKLCTLPMFFSYLGCVFMDKFQTNHTCAYLKLSYLLNSCMLLEFLRECLIFGLF